jgi:formiminoglutamase
VKRVRAAANFLSGEDWRSDERYDVVVVGIPDSSMSLAHSHAYAGPAALRRLSTTFSSPESTRARRGWADLRTGRRVGAGLRWADAGDLVLDREKFTEDRADIAGAVACLRDSARTVIALLGDDSLTYEVFRHAEGSLLHCDAHEDRAPLVNGHGPNHANVITHLARTTSLEIGQMGPRGFSPESGEAFPNCSRLRGKADLTAWLDGRTAGQGVNLAIDVDVFDPCLISSVTCPLPAGWSVHDMTEVVELLAAGGPIPVITLSEFAPEPSSRRAQIEALTLTWLLVDIVDRAFT